MNQRLDENTAGGSTRGLTVVRRFAHLVSSHVRGGQLAAALQSSVAGGSRGQGPMRPSPVPKMLQIHLLRRPVPSTDPAPDERRYENGGDMPRRFEVLDRVDQAPALATASSCRSA